MEYCPRCRKMVNVQLQTTHSAGQVHTSYFCEECGITISGRSSLKKKRSLNDDIDVIKKMIDKRSKGIEKW